MYIPQILSIDPYSVRKYVLDPMNRKKCEVYSRFLQNLKGDLAVDLGCGHGVLTNLVAQNFSTVFAIDQYKSMTDFCRDFSRRNENENITPSLASVYYIPLKSNSADLVTATGLVNISKHLGIIPNGIPKNEKRNHVLCFLAETNRILKINGTLIFDVPLILWDLWYLSSNVLKRRFQEVELESNCPIHVLKPWKWKDELRDMGFSSQEIIGCHFSPFRKRPQKHTTLEKLLEKQFPYICRMMVIMSKKVKDVHSVFHPYSMVRAKKE